MTFVTDDQIEAVQFTGTPVDRLDAGYDDGLLCVTSFQTGGVDTELNVWADGTQFIGGLLEQFLDVSQNQDATIPFHHRVPTDGGQAGRLPSCGGQYDAWVIVPRPQVVVDGLHGIALVGSKR
jgi:hypothetical protein